MRHEARRVRRSWALPAKAALLETLHQPSAFERNEPVHGFGRRQAGHGRPGKEFRGAQWQATDTGRMAADLAQQNVRRFASEQGAEGFSTQISKFVEREMTTVDFIKKEIAEAEQAVKYSMEAEQVFRSGTDADWKIAANLHPSTRGRPMNKNQRIEAAEKEARIAAICRHKLEMFQAVLKQLEP